MGEDEMTDFLMWIGGIVAGGIFSLIGWVFKMVFDAIKNLEKEIQSHKLHAAENFATKVEVNDGFDRVMKKLDKIDDKLDSKVDK